MVFQRQMTSLPAIGALLCAVCVLGVAPLRAAEEVFVVTASAVPDQKAVFATVESRRVVPGRSRIGGTVAAIAVKEGDHVDLGQVIATVGDDKLALQMKSLDAQIAGLLAELPDVTGDGVDLAALDIDAVAARLEEAHDVLVRALESVEKG